MSVGSRVVRAKVQEAADSFVTAAPSDVVIVKLRPRGAARSATAVSAASESLLTRLVSDGYAREVRPVFRGPASFTGARGAERLPAMAQVESGLVRARSLVTVRVDPTTDAGALARHLAEAGEVEYAYVPPVKHVMATARHSRTSGKPAPSFVADPLASRQWSHGAVRIHEARARAGFVDANDVVVAVVDTGIDVGHPDLRSSIDSYVNHVSPGEDDLDYKGHGTHVAGIIAAGIANGVGISGLCRAKIMALKALPRTGRPWDPEAYYRALGAPIGTAAKVLNLSLGGGYDPGERDVILDVLDAGITVVAAMGNDYLRGNPVQYPAAYERVIAVGASDEVDRRAVFSCTGKHIALVAPGERIVSTVPTYPSELAATRDYDSWPGTSMATPHVAAAAALLLAKEPALSPGDVKKRLRDTADRVPTQSGVSDEEFGAGRLNVAALLA